MDRITRTFVVCAFLVGVFGACIVVIDGYQKAAYWRAGIGALLAAYLSLYAWRIFTGESGWRG
jgi:hypothetical protein